MTEERPDLRGVTVNEALVTAGQMEQWDAAIEAGDRHAAIEILRKFFNESSAVATVDAVLADPSKYGYPRGA